MLKLKVPKQDCVSLLPFTKPCGCEVRCCDCDHYVPVVKRKIGDCFHPGYIDIANLQFQAHSCPEGKMIRKDFKCTRAVRISKYRHEKLKWHMNEISKHMADLSGEFEDLFDPYLPIASKLKMKMCPSLGTIEFCESEPGYTLEVPSSYHGKWKVRVGADEMIEVCRGDDKSVTVSFDVVD